MHLAEGNLLGPLRLLLLLLLLLHAQILCRWHAEALLATLHPVRVKGVVLRDVGRPVGVSNHHHILLHLLRGDANFRVILLCLFTPGLDWFGFFYHFLCLQMLLCESWR